MGMGKCHNLFLSYLSMIYRYNLFMKLSISSRFGEDFVRYAQMISSYCLNSAYYFYIVKCKQTQFLKIFMV